MTVAGGATTHDARLDDIPVVSCGTFAFKTLFALTQFRDLGVDNDGIGVPVGQLIPEFLN